MKLWFLHVVRDLGHSLHVRRNFGIWLWSQLNWCCSVYILGHSFVSKSLKKCKSLNFLIFLPISATLFLKTSSSQKMYCKINKIQLTSRFIKHVRGVAIRRGQVAWPPSSVSELSKIQKFQFQTSEILLFTDV